MGAEVRTLNLAAPAHTLPLTLYVHFPWCERKCPYCDYNSHEFSGTIPEACYLAALRADLEDSAAQLRGRNVGTVYLGGGTPSLLSPDGFATLLSDVRALLSLTPGAETTVEANPGSADAGRFAAYAAAGATRVSLGVQSLDDGNLRTLGRIHDSAAAAAAAAAALRSFPRVNLDLMTALPGQSPEQAAADAAALAALGAEHLSVYRLSREPGTLFWKNPPPGMLADDEAADAEDAARETIGRAGYKRYEVCAYSRGADARCRHNLNYWMFGDYLGIGAGAHSKLSGPDGTVRLVRHKSPRRYMDAGRRTDKKRFVASSRRLSVSDLVSEFMLNALRLVDGFPAGMFAERTGLAPGMIAAGLAEGADRGLLVREDDMIRPSSRGMDLLNNLVGLFMPAHR